MARILFIQTGWFEHLGLLGLAALARAQGHSVSLMVSRRPDSILYRIHEEAPQVVAFSATTGAHKTALALVRAIRPSFKGIIILGGPHPTFFPEAIEEPGLDAICRGEGENSLSELLARLDQEKEWDDVPGLWVKRGNEIRKNPPARLIADLNTLPFPARDLLYEADPLFRRSSMRRVMAGRGCPYVCAYCFNQAMRELVSGLGPYLRQRSVDHVIAELKILSSEGRPTINFVDDTFGLKRSWSLEFLDRYAAEIALPFIVNLRPEQVDAELSRALAVAGCYCAQVGIESADAGLRREVLGRETSDEVLTQAVRSLQAAGIKALTYNIVGLPGERVEGAAATLAWNWAARVEFPRFSIFQPYPRTALGDKVLAEARGRGETSPSAKDLDSISESYFRRSPLSGPEFRRIENLHKLFWPFIHFPSLRPLILALTRLPANPLFDLAFLVAMAFQYRKATNRGWVETIELGLRNLRLYFT